MKFFFIKVLLLFSVVCNCQNPIPVQVSLPVYLDDPSNSNAYLEGSPLISLCGIAMYFLDTTQQHEKVIYTGLDDPLIWFDQVGISNKVRFVIADSMNVMSMDLIYANEVCKVNLIKEDAVIVNGSITKDFGHYTMRLSGDDSHIPDILKLFGKINSHMLKLHAKEKKEILVSRNLDQDSLNLILGYDYSFDTNFDVSIFDESLRNRIKQLAQSSFESINNDEYGEPIVQTVKSAALVDHVASKVQGNDRLIKGNLSVVFEIKNDKRYMFLHPNNRYLIEIEYKYKKWGNEHDRLMIEQFGIKNVENDDFIKMDIFDLTGSGIPVLYVDLINGVVMEDGGAWDANQFVMAIQEIFRMVKLPEENG